MVSFVWNARYSYRKHQNMEGVWVDTCSEHGEWLDKSEIESLIEAARKKGKDEGFVESLWMSQAH